MPNPNAAKAVNPRYDAMKSIVQNRLNDTGTESGQSLTEIMEAQGMEMVDLDAPLAPATKDSDSHVDQNRAVVVDIHDDTFTPEEDAIKTETAAEAEQIAVETEKPIVAAEALAGETAAALEAAAAEELTGSPVYERDGEYYTKITVNGVEEEVEFDTLRASAQKDKASFQRFQAAADKEQDVEVREARLTAAQAKQAVVVPSTPPPAKLTEEEINDTVDKLYDSLAYEDEDTVKAKLAEIVSGPPAAPQEATGREEVSTQNEPVDIQEQVEAALERKAIRDWESARTAAVAQWEIDYADINSDEDLRGFANEESARIAALHPQQSIQETLKQAGDKARQWRDFQAGKAPTVDSATAIDTESRKANKRAAAAPVRANGTAATREAKDDKPPSRSDVVAAIRAGRGQAAV